MYKTLEAIVELMPPKWRPNRIQPELVLEPKADTSYNIVNQADRIAYQLKLYHEKKGSPKDAYLEHKLSPDWKRFNELFDYIGAAKK